MVRCCGVCKKEWNGIDSRSFHSFPVNEELRKKWIEILGLGKSVPKSFSICSNHFDKKSYSDTQTTKRLRKDALPIDPSAPKSSSVIIAQTSDLYRNSVTENQDFFMDSCQKEDFCNKHPSASLAFRPIINEQRKILPETFKNSIEVLTGVSFNSVKPKIDGDTLLFDGQTHKPVKKRRCWNSSTPNLPRKLFVSDAAYQSFLNYALSRRKTAKYKSQNLRKRIKNKLKKIEKLKALAQKLKEKKKESREEEYQRLPPLIADILSRIKKRKKVYTSFMQDFVKSIHGSSPSTYELIRNNYLNCLPHPNSVLNWKKPKPIVRDQHKIDYVKIMVLKFSRPFTNDIKVDEIDIVME